MRQMTRQTSSLKPIFHNQGCTVTEEREPLMDQYGIRTRLNVGGETTKFKIVLEGRVRLDPPGPEDPVCTVSCLTLADRPAAHYLPIPIVGTMTESSTEIDWILPTCRCDQASYSTPDLKRKAPTGTPSRRT